VTAKDRIENSPPIGLLPNGEPNVVDPSKPKDESWLIIVDPDDDGEIPDHHDYDYL
jgi:hypothetical protein